MLSIARNHIVILAQGRDSADPDCFLPDVQMTKAADLSQAVRLGTFLFKAPDQKHLMKDLHQCLAILFNSRRCWADFVLCVGRCVQQSGCTSRGSIGFFASVSSLSAHLISVPA